MTGRNRAYFQGGDDEYMSYTADEVVEVIQDHRTNTGLLNAAGKPIYRYRETVTFGFVPTTR